MVLFSLSPLAITLIVISVILIAAIVFLAIWGRKQQKKMEESQKQIEASAQQMTMLIIDKKKMRMKDAGLPQVVYESTPKFARLSKVPVVKAKVGPRVMTLISDIEIFDMIPVKQEVKATVSGIYITKVRSLRGPALVKPSKKTFRQKLMAKIKSANAELDAEKKSSKKASGKQQTSASVKNTGKKKK